jgi:hypothetical protein
LDPGRHWSHRVSDGFARDTTGPACHDKGKKTRAQVFGEPVAIDGKEVHDFGYQARQLDEMLRANGLTTRPVIVDGGKSEDEIRRDLVENLSRKGDYAIVAYQRKAVGQPGFGHISPLGAYDAQSDSFLVLDVNPSTAVRRIQPVPATGSRPVSWRGNEVSDFHH